MMDERKNVHTIPNPHLLQAQKALALLLSKLEGRPGTEEFTQHHCTTRYKKRKANLLTVIGLTTSQRCGWHMHIEYVTEKACARINILRRYKSFSTENRYKNCTLLSYVLFSSMLT